MGTRNAVLLATGLIFLSGGPSGPTTAMAEPMASVSPDMGFGAPYPHLSLPRAPRRSPVDSALDAIAAEVDYSGRRLMRITSSAREGVMNLLRGEVSPQRPQAILPAAPPVSAPSPRRGDMQRPSRGPSDATLDEMSEKLYALRTPPISAWPERPPRGGEARPAAPAVPEGATDGDGTATGARRLLRRLEDRGDMVVRQPQEDGAQGWYTAALPPALLDSRFNAWTDGKAAPQAGEDVYGFSSECLDGRRLPGGPVHQASMRRPGDVAAGGSLRAASVNRPRVENPEHRSRQPGSGVAHLAAILPDSPRRLADGSVFLPKLTQRLLSVRTVQVCVAETPRINQLIGKVIGNPNASGLVQAGQVGRIRPGPGGLPEIGMRVRKGQPLGVLMPSLTTVERGQLESQLAELRSEIIYKELSLARMRDFPIVPFRTGRMLALRLELDGLRKRRDLLISGIDNHEMLMSPMDGVISRADIVSGQLVHAGDTLWQVVDPRRMRIEAIAFDESVARAIHSAWALTSENEVMQLSFVGRSMSLMNQGIPLHFDIRNHGEGLSVGTPVSVYVSAGRGEQAAILPKSALVRDDAGRTIVWEHVEGERFIPRHVLAEPLNGWQIVVRDGVADNARIVHIGADHLSQVR